MGIKVELMLDDSLRGQILQFVRDQVRPLVKESFGLEVDSAKRIALQLMNSVEMRASVLGEVRSLLEAKGSRYGATVKDVILDEVKKTTEAVAKSVIDEAYVKVLKPLLRETIREEVRALLNGR